MRVTEAIGHDAHFGPQCVAHSEAIGTASATCRMAARVRSSFVHLRSEPDEVGQRRLGSVTLILRVGQDRCAFHNLRGSLRHAWLAARHDWEAQHGMTIAEWSEATWAELRRRAGSLDEFSQALQLTMFEEDDWSDPRTWTAEQVAAGVAAQGRRSGRS
jgi:hypothetical protein